mgnify:CR=1 FL=1
MVEDRIGIGFIGAGAIVRQRHAPGLRKIGGVEFVAVANRVGTERGCEFCGHSKIVDLRGETVAEADGTKETILYGEFDIAEADQNHIATKPGEWELDRIADRRPELYTALTEPLPKNLKTPREKAGVRVKDEVKV